MKIRLTRPLPQLGLGRVIPAGVVIDAPPALSERLLREGRGKPLQREEPASEAKADCIPAVSVPAADKPPRKKVKRRG